MHTPLQANRTVAVRVSARVGEAVSVISSKLNPESLVRRLRALADKRQKEAAREGRLIAQGLLGAADGYRALADALERQPSLSWLQPKPAANDDKATFKDTAEPKNSSAPPTTRRFDAA